MYRIDVIFNGGTSTQSCALSGSAPAGTSITVSKEAVGFESYFGSAPDVICASLGVNGDDVVELYNDKDNTVIDAYGVLGVDGTGEDWEYTDGFAYRISGTANGGAFDVDEWFVSGPGALDGCMTNSECEGGSVPLGELFQPTTECRAYGTTCGISGDPNQSEPIFVVDVNGQTCPLAEASGESGTYRCDDQDARASSKSGKGGKLNECKADCDTCGPGPTKNDCCGSCGPSEYCCKDRESRPATGPLLLTALIDGPLTGGLPKAVEIAVLEDVSDLSMYSIDVILNGGTSTRSCALSGSASAGTYITVSKEAVDFESYFGSAPDVICASFIVNGNDVVELYKDNTVIDAYGDGTDGTGKDWEYTDGFAYRIFGTTNDGAVFNVAEWFVSGPDALDGCITNSDCEGGYGSVPLGLFQDKKADCACHYDDGHAPDCPSSMDIDGREFDCAKSEAGAASGPISGTIRRPPGAVGEFGSARCYIAVDSYGGKSGKAKGEYYPSSRSGLDV